jgi:hypothetical protein
VNAKSELLALMFERVERHAPAQAAALRLLLFDQFANTLTEEECQMLTRVIEDADARLSPAGTLRGGVG